MGDGITYYEILGVKRTASPDEIKAAYRQAARKYHPDRLAGSDGESHLFALVGSAYEVLADPGRRAEYDRDLDGPPPTAQPPQAWSPPAGPVYTPPPPAPAPPTPRSGRGGGWLLLAMIAGGVAMWTICRHGVLGGWLRANDPAFFLAILAAVAVPVLPLLVAYLVRRMIRCVPWHFR